MRIVTSVAGLIVAFAAATTAFGQGADPRDRLAPTVRGGTGLFDTYSTRTLDKGEVGVGVFRNDFDRQPGDIDITQVPVNFTLGLTDRWEVWANLNVWQQTTVRQPFLLSGYGYNAVEAYRRSAYAFFGPPFGGTDGGAAYFPGTGSLGGGILPVLGRFGTPITPGGAVVLSDTFGVPTGSVGNGPAIVTDRPGYYPDLPFLGQVDFLGLDAFGRPVFGPRESGNGLGDALVGTKVEVVDPDVHPHFSLAVGGTVTIPTARNRDALARGRTAGEVDFGPFVALGHELADGRLGIYENASYTVTGDPNVGDVKTLDRPDELGLGIGLSGAPNEHVELIGELNWTRYVGGQTPNLDQNDPLDLTLGARFFAFDGRLSFGGAYRRLLNGGGDRTLPVLTLTFGPPGPAPTTDPTFVLSATPTAFPAGDRNGFVAYVGFRFGRGPRWEALGPTPPMCTGVSAERGEIFTGDSVALMANATDADGDVLTYTWTATGGRVVGGGSSVTFDATGLAEGGYVVTAQTSDGFGHTVECSTTVYVKARPNVCPTLSVVADKTSVTVGETVTFTATAADPDDGPSPIALEWDTSAGSLRRVSDNEVQLDTTGLADSITVTVTATDGDRNCGTTASARVEVKSFGCGLQVRIEDLLFLRDRARVTDAMKRILDDVAVRLEQDPTLSVAVFGYADAGERPGIALRRAENARQYLVTERGIDASRIVVRSFDDRCPRGTPEANRRVEMYLRVPGHNLDEILAPCR